MKRFISFIIALVFIVFMFLGSLNSTWADTYKGFSSDVNEVLGDSGRLYIPSVDVSVALYDSHVGGSYVQWIVDNWDSAAWCESFKGGCGYIADHWNQGFINIKECNTGDFAYIKTRDDVRIFECIANTNGYNIEDSIVTYEGEDLRDIDWADFCCYTCNGNWRNIIMVFFKEVEETEE